MDNKIVLVIDDEEFIRELVGDFLELENIRSDEAGEADAALEKFTKNYYDLVLLDVNLGGSRAEDIILRMRETKPSTPVVLLTGDPQYDQDYAKKIHARGVIYKPFQVDNFLATIKSFLENA